MIGVRLALLDRQVDALEDLLGDALGVDGDVQVADFQSAMGYSSTFVAT
jgi:hypothetical protein